MDVSETWVKPLRRNLLLYCGRSNATNLPIKGMICTLFIALIRMVILKFIIGATYHLSQYCSDFCCGEFGENAEDGTMPTSDLIDLCLGTKGFPGCYDLDFWIYEEQVTCCMGTFQLNSLFVADLLGK